MLYQCEDFLSLFHKIAKEGQHKKIAWTSKLESRSTTTTNNSYRLRKCIPLLLKGFNIVHPCMIKYRFMQAKDIIWWREVSVKNYSFQQREKLSDIQISHAPLCVILISQTLICFRNVPLINTYTIKYKKPVLI